MREGQSTPPELTICCAVQVEEEPANSTEQDSVTGGGQSGSRRSSSTAVPERPPDNVREGQSTPPELTLCAVQVKDEPANRTEQNSVTGGDQSGSRRSSSTAADNESMSVYHVAFRIFCEVLDHRKSLPPHLSLLKAVVFLLVSAWLQIHLLVVILKSISWQLGPSVSDVASTLYSLSGAPPAPPPLMDGYVHASNKLAVVISRLLVLLYITGVAEDECKFNDNIPEGVARGPFHTTGCYRFWWYLAYVGAILCPITQSCVAGFAVYVTYAYLNKFETVGEVVLNGVGISFVLGIDDVLGSKLKDAVSKSAQAQGNDSSTSDCEAPGNTNSLRSNRRAKRLLKTWSRILRIALGFIYVGYTVLCLYCLCNVADWRYDKRTVAVFTLAFAGFMFTMSSGRWVLEILAPLVESILITIFGILMLVVRLKKAERNGGPMVIDTNFC